METFGEQMHLMGQIEALLKQELKLKEEIMQLESRLAKMKEGNNELQRNS